ncbi:MAG: sensor histidine kinase [Bacteroidota bacterium]
MTQILRKIFLSRIALHVYFWIFTFFIFSIIYIYPEIIKEGVVKNLIYFPAVIAFTYFFLYVLNKLIIKKKKFFLFIFAFVLSVIVYTLIIYGIDQTIIPYILGKSDFLRYNLNTFFQSAWGVVLIAMGAGYIKMIRTWNITDQYKIQLELEKTQAYNQLLRSKINPHFLFNTLNNITSLLEFDNNKAKKSIIELGELMAYMVYEADEDFVPLEKEIIYIRDFVALQSLRIGKDDFVNFDLNGDPSGLEIASMLLIPFVENTFKYCDKSACPGIFIQINIENGQLQFRTGNKISPDQKVLNEKGGFGIKNVKKRLEQLYPGKYSLDIDYDREVGGYYRVGLEIGLNQGS